MLDQHQEITAADLIGGNLDLGSFLRGMHRLAINFGVVYGEQDEKVLDLFDELVAARWSTERYDQTIRWILRHHKYPNWTTADFFSAPMQKLFSYAHFLAERDKKGGYMEADVDWYSVEGRRMYALKKEGRLPFPRWEEPRHQKEPEGPFASKEEIRRAFAPFLGEGR